MGLFSNKGVLNHSSAKSRVKNRKSGVVVAGRRELQA
jgi:hypothetical protein